MPAIRGLTVSVGYSETLRICLPRNMRHLAECWVITSPDDHETQEVARSVPGVRLSITNDFTAYGARFNKGLAVERSGFDMMGRYGLILVHDADILFPDVMPLDNLEPTKLHGARRRILQDPGNWHPELDWKTCPLRRDGGAIGFFQLFHADAIKHKSPWYDVSFAHAGGGDAYFLTHWPHDRMAILPIEVLHLGRPDLNWMGTDQASRDIMAKYVTQNHLSEAMKNFDPAAVQRAGDVPGRIEVPGYPPSGFRLPFEERAARDRARQQGQTRNDGK